MTGIIDVGGGTRGVFGCGVFDRCLDDGISFDLVIGVSAGSANGASFLAGQRGRNYRFYTEYAFRKEYMGVTTLLHTGSVIGLEYIYGTLSNTDGEYPLDYDAMMASPTDFEVVATDAETGRPVYFKKQDMTRDRYVFFMASCCVPVVCRPYDVDGVKYLDGGVSDPVPLERAIKAGCDRIIVILTKPVDVPISNKRNALAAAVLRPRYPQAAKSTEKCNAVYTENVKKALALQEQGKALVLAPDSISGLKTLSTDLGALQLLYEKGYEAGAKIADFLQKQ